MSTWHIIEFYHHKMREAVLGRAPYRYLPFFTKAHDAYMIEHDKAAAKAEQLAAANGLNLVIESREERERQMRQLEAEFAKIR